MKNLPIVIVKGLIGSLTGVAHDVPADEVRQQTVSFADLNLNRSEEVQELYWRIRSAAREVCCIPGELTLAIHYRMRYCAAQATAQAVMDVNAPLLTHYYTARNASAYIADAQLPAFA